MADKEIILKYIRNNPEKLDVKFQYKDVLTISKNIKTDLGANTGAGIEYAVLKFLQKYCDIYDTNIQSHFEEFSQGDPRRSNYKKSAKDEWTFKMKKESMKGPKTNIQTSNNVNKGKEDLKKERLDKLVIRETSITLKSVSELRNKTFNIPAYQRGYRWGERQVTELLNDLSEFSGKEKQKDEFYCLQPLVIAKNGKLEWEVIDGQQRLSTTFLILNYLNKRFTEDRRKPLFEINYQTRKHSREFLKRPDSKKQNDNIDFYHIYQANEIIENWFKEKLVSSPDFDEGDIEKTLSKRTKFIWYEVQIEDTAEAIDIFTRINIGKIPLTNAELIKALFLNRDNFKKLTDNNIRLKQLQIAAEWDRIEYQLQENEFWYFLHDDASNYPTRIELIFNLLVKKGESSKPHDDPYFTFIKYKDKFDREKEIDKAWKEIKNYFLTFEEWYKNKEMYHLIGFLIAVGNKLTTIINNSHNKTKTEFKNYLKSLISKRINTTVGDLDSLEYGDKRIKAILLLHNIETIISSHHSDMRFPFNKFKIEDWDIEHIRATADNIPVRVEDQRKWLAVMSNSYENSTSKNNKIKTLLKESNILLEKERWDKDENKFTELYHKWLEHFKEKDNPEWINSIGNLTLLDQETNRSYKNAVYSIKRNVIIDKDKSVKFIPVCTKNVFLKYYSENIENMQYWTEKDVNRYLNNIREVLENYLGEDKNE